MKENDFNFLCRKTLVEVLTVCDGYKHCTKLFDNDFEAVAQHMLLLKEDILKIKLFLNENLVKTKKDEVSLKKIEEIGFHLKSLGAFLILTSNMRTASKQNAFFDEVNKIKELLNILSVEKIENSYVSEDKSILARQFDPNFYLKLVESKNLFETDCKKNVLNFFEKSKSDENLLSNNVFFMAQVLNSSKAFSPEAKAQLYNFCKDDLLLLSFCTGAGIVAQVELLKNIKCFFEKQNNQEFCKEIDLIAKKLFLISMSNFSENALKLNWNSFFNEKEIVSFAQIKNNKAGATSAENKAFDRDSLDNLNFDKIVKNYWTSGFGLSRSVNIILGLKEQSFFSLEGSFYNKNFRENYFNLLKKQYPQIFEIVALRARVSLIESSAPRYLLNSSEKTSATEVLDFLEQMSSSKINEKSVILLKWHLSNDSFMSKKASSLKSFVLPEIKKILESERQISSSIEEPPLILNMAKNYAQSSKEFKEIIRQEIKEIIENENDLSIRTWFSKSSGVEVSLLMSLMILAAERKNSIEEKEFFSNCFVSLMQLGASATKQLSGSTKNVLEKSKSAQYLKPMNALIEKFIIEQSIAEPMDNGPSTSCPTVRSIKLL